MQAEGRTSHRDKREAAAGSKATFQGAPASKAMSFETRKEVTQDHMAGDADQERDRAPVAAPSTALVP